MGGPFTGRQETLGGSVNRGGGTEVGTYNQLDHTDRERDLTLEDSSLV